MLLHLGWPQLIMLACMSFGVMHSIVHYGEQKKGSAAVYDATDVIIGPALSLLILFWGGFFSPVCQ